MSIENCPVVRNNTEWLDIQSWAVNTWAPVCNPWPPHIPTFGGKTAGQHLISCLTEPKLHLGTYNNNIILYILCFVCEFFTDEPKSMGLYLLNAGHKQVHISVSIVTFQSWSIIFQTVARYLVYFNSHEMFWAV